MGDFEDSYLGRLRTRVGHELLLSPGVQIVLARSDGRVLVQQRTDSGQWELPAGACEPGQSFRVAAASELLEETGIAIAPDELLAFATFSDPVEHLLTYPNGDVVHAFSVCFWANVGDLEAAGNDGESSGHQWVMPDEIPAPAYPPSELVLQRFLIYRQTGEFQAD